MNDKNDSHKLLIGLAVSIIVLSFIILVVYLLEIFFHTNLFSKNEVSIEKTGQFGDFFGGVIGSILNFAGVILFFTALHFQRKEFTISREQLRLQFDEMTNQTKEFEINRITNVIYKQLEIADDKLYKLKINLNARNLDAEGMGVLQAIHNIGEQILSRFKSYEELNELDKAEFDFLIKFSSNQLMRNYLASIDNSIKIFNSLVMPKDNDIPVMERQHLYLLLYHNFNLKKVDSLLIVLIKLHTIEYDNIDKSDDPDGLSELLYGEKIMIHKRLKSKIENIKNNCT